MSIRGLASEALQENIRRGSNSRMVTRKVKTGATGLEPRDLRRDSWASRFAVVRR
jgi:hypothetical protein